MQGATRLSQKPLWNVFPPSTSPFFFLPLRPPASILMGFYSLQALL